MNLEQLALLGIAVFVLMLMANAFGAVRTIKRTFGRSGARRRFRRAISGEGAAQALAFSLVEEVARRHGAEVERSREADRPTPALQEALDQARTYFLERVDTLQKEQFTLAVDQIIFRDTQMEVEDEGHLD